MPTRRTTPPDWVITRRRELGERIADCRRAAGLSQDQLADHVGVERRSIQRYERGERDVGFAVLLLIAERTGCEVADLVRGIKAGPGGG
ncbi:helix-turn-helix transcriptional regulator [Streptomyces lavendulocolor]|uniref:Helix-turn-helix transcriptional regulator n=1 Tax=Streptomyces lavendulocolor TaxID=67316 RepID=A0ABV2VY70_9ACTN